MATLQINGINLAYEVKGEGVPILFLHGLGSCMADWEAQTEAFSKTNKVITYDQRGHGASDKPAGPYSIKMFADDAQALLRALDIESVHVVGISMGGAISFQLAVDAPGLLKSLTVVNSAPGMQVGAFWLKLEVWRRTYIVKKMGMAKLGAAIAPRLFPEEGMGALRTAFMERYARNDSKAYLASLRALVGWGVMDRLGEIRCPTLILAADQDYTPLRMKEAYVGKIPGARLQVIPNSRHALPMERPEQFNTALREFIVANS